jgi:UDP-N-acetylmuramoyl-tripeptide--D-alanyl-D-alanine ligase
MKQFLKAGIVALLTWEAQILLKRHKPLIIAVTGSVGKTTTKDAIFHVLKDTASVRKSEKSFNSEIGIPLTILGLSNAWSNPRLWILRLKLGFWRAVFAKKYPQVLVLEIGADHPGDIARVTKWIRPDIAVITRLPERPVHVEYFSSPEEVRKEKWELARAVSPDGVLVINGDDSYLREFSQTITARVLTFGFGEHNDVTCGVPQVQYDNNTPRHPIGMSFHVRCGDKNFPINLTGVLGTQSATAALAACAVGFARGESVERMARALETFTMPPGRMRIIQGKQNSVIIDDSYNSSPVAAEAALETLRTIDGKRKIALLGDMLELGKFAEEEHRKIGAIAGGFVNLLLLVGKRAEEWMDLGANSAGLAKEKIMTFADSEAAGKWMSKHLEEGDIILAKGSQGSGENMIRMERAVKLLMERPEDAEKLLVRQEDEWQRQYQ